MVTGRQQKMVARNSYLTRPFYSHLFLNQYRGSSASSSSSSASSGKYRCKEIGSWDKAQVPLKQGHTYLDRDGDGEECESLK